MLTEFFTVTCIGLLVVISPGPDFAMVTRTSLLEGRLAGWAAALGISMANLCHVAINLLGIGIIIAQSLAAFTIMKILGAAYLLYIGFKGLGAKPLLVSLGLQTSGEALARSSNKHLIKKGFKSGFLTSVLNPKACLFFLSFFSIILSSHTPLLRQVLYGVWISLLALFWFSTVAFFFTNPLVSAKLKKSKHWIERFTGGVLIFLGAKLLSSEAAL